MYIWYSIHRGKERMYSPKKETLTEAYEWYESKGKNLEKMFNRTLKLKQT